MRSGDLIPHPDFGALPCSFEVQHRSALRERVLDAKPGPVPAGAAISRNIRIAGVIVVEAMRNRNGLPGDNLFALPDLEPRVQWSLVIFPAGGESSAQRFLSWRGGILQDGREQGHPHGSDGA